MAHQGYLRRIAKVEQCLSDVVTCGMLSNCVRMVCDLLTCLGRHSAKIEPLLEITDGWFKAPRDIFIIVNVSLMSYWLILPDMLVNCWNSAADDHKVCMAGILRHLDKTLVCLGGSSAWSYCKGGFQKVGIRSKPWSLTGTANCLLLSNLQIE